MVSPTRSGHFLLMGLVFFYAGMPGFVLNRFYRAITQLF